MTAFRGALAAGPDDGLDGATLELTVGPIAHGGHCVARHDGRVVFVRHALPGERVRAVVTEDHGTYLRADAVAVLDASPRRVTPPCPWARSGSEDAEGARRPRLCGGCDLQHADLAYQRELKSAVLREQLVRLGGLDASTVDRLDPVVQPLPPVPGEPDGQGWRTRVQYTVDSTGRAGLLAHRSHEVVPVDRCLIAHAAIRNTDVLQRPWPDHDPGREREAGASNPAIAGPHTVEVIAGADGAVTVLARRGGGQASLVSGPTTVTERAVGRRWDLPPTAFWQVHPFAADTLADAVVDLLAPRPGERIADLYGGAGLFAAALAQAGAAGPREQSIEVRAGAPGPAPIMLVEGDAAAVAAARANLRDLTPVTVVHSDVARVLGVAPLGQRKHRGAATPARRPRWDRPDLVVLDPPRSGAGREVVAAVAAGGPRAVAYVACDPAALARDVRTLRACGYELSALWAYDLFPHTHHLEVVALLTPA